MSLGLPISIMTGVICGFVYRPGTNIILNRTVLILECLALLSLASVIASVASYPLAAISKGWWDIEFLAADAAMGLDWRTYWNFSTSHSTVIYIFSWAYGSFFVMPTVVVAALITAGRVNEAYRFISAFIIALVITDVCVALFPARSAAVNLLPLGSPFAPPSGMLHIPVIEGLRNGSFKVIELASMNGLIALPSFHAAASVLFAWGGWQVRLVRMPILTVEGLMLASTPINGGHYFIDVLAGLGVALIAIGVSYAVSRTGVKGESFSPMPVTA